MESQEATIVNGKKSFLLGNIVSSVDVRLEDMIKFVSIQDFTHGSLYM